MGSRVQWKRQGGEWQEVGGQRLLDMIETLKMEHHMEAHKNGHANGHLSIGTDVPAPDGSFSIKVKPNGMPNGYRKEREVSVLSPLIA